MNKLTERELLAWVCDYMVRQCLQTEPEGKIIYEQIVKMIGGLSD